MTERDLRMVVKSRTPRPVFSVFEHKGNVREYAWFEFEDGWVPSAAQLPSLVFDKLHVTCASLEAAFSELIRACRKVQA